MDIRPIRTDEDHCEALQEIERLWSFPDDSVENDKLEVLSILVEDYENKRWPMVTTTPRDILEYATTELGRSQTELAELLGSRSQASELLNGRRRISLDAAQKISAAWNIPIQLLVAPHAEEPVTRKVRRVKDDDLKPVPGLGQKKTKPAHSMHASKKAI